MRTYLDYWNLTRRPFESTNDKEMFFAGRQHREALERLLYLVRDGNMGFGLLTGEIGCGKTMVIRVLQSRLQGRDCGVVFLENAYSNFNELLQDTLAGMNSGPATCGRRRRQPPAGVSRYELVHKFRDQLWSRFARLKRRLLVILDEAQQLSEEALVELKNLTNLSESGGQYFSIILSGQPELSALVQSLPPVDQRVGLRYHLLPLEESEVGAYVDARMSAAGYSGDSAFSAAAKSLLHRETAGIPREVNRVCKLALDRAFSLNQTQVETAIIQSLVDDVLRQKAMV